MSNNDLMMVEVMRDMGNWAESQMREKAETFARFIVNQFIYDIEEDEDVGVPAFRLCALCSTHGPSGGPTKHDSGCIVARAEEFVACNKQEDAK